MQRNELIKWKQLEAFFKEDWVIKQSTHLYRKGLKEKFYFDFDNLTTDSINCRKITELYCKKIEKIKKSKDVDYLAFIEKASGGTVGAIRFAAAISIFTELPNITIRLAKEISYERVKFNPPEKLKGLIGLIITDHITTGTEVLLAVDAIEENEGKISDIVTYALRVDKVNRNEFEKRNINLHFIYELKEKAGETLSSSFEVVPSEDLKYEIST